MMTEYDQSHSELMSAMKLLLPSHKEATQPATGKREGQALTAVPRKHRRLSGKGAGHSNNEGEASLVMAMARLLLQHEDSNALHLELEFMAFLQTGRGGVVSSMLTILEA